MNKFCIFLLTRYGCSTVFKKEENNLISIDTFKKFNLKLMQILLYLKKRWFFSRSRKKLQDYWIFEMISRFWKFYFHILKNKLIFESTKYTLCHIFLNEKALGASYDSLLSKKGPKLKFRDEKKSRDFKISSRIGKINFNKYTLNL